MMKVGFIHFDCFCGLDIYFFGDLANGEPPVDAIELFRARVGNHQHAIFTTFDESVVTCPSCNSLIQLPTAQVAAFLGKMSSAAFNIDEGEKKVFGKVQNYHHKKSSDDYNRFFSELN